MIVLKRKYSFIVNLLFILSISCKAQCNKSYGNSLQECKLITIEELKTSKKLYNNCYNIIGYINRIRNTYKCPKEAICKISPPPTLYISSKYKNNINEELSLNLPFDKEGEFKKGNYGIFTFINNSTINPNIKNLLQKRYSLIGYNIWVKPQ